MHETLRRFSRRPHLSIVCTALFAASLSGCGGGGDSKGRIVGTVYAGDPSATSRTSSGITVRVVRLRNNGSIIPDFVPIVDATSDQNGNFTVSVPSGEYNVYAVNGYGFSGTTATFCTLFRSTKVSSGQSSNVRLGYVPCDGSSP